MNLMVLTFFILVVSFEPYTIIINGRGAIVYPFLQIETKGNFHNVVELN